MMIFHVLVYVICIPVYFHMILSALPCRHRLDVLTYLLVFDSIISLFCT